MKWCIIFFTLIFSGWAAVSDNINEFLFKIEANFEFLDLTFNSYDNKRDFRPRFCTGLPVSEKDEQYTWYSLTPKESTVDSTPIKNLILPLIIADISDKVNGDSEFVLQKHHLDYFLNNYFGRTYQPCLLVFKFGWSKFYVDEKKYYGFQSRNGSLQHPGISEEVAKWITTAYKNIVGVGVDVPTVDPGNSTGRAALKTLTSHGVYVLDHVKLDQYLPEAWCTAMVLPMKITKSCSPYRLIVICPKSKMERGGTFIHRL